MNVNSFAIYVFLLQDLSLAFERDKNGFFIRHRMTTWDKMRGKKERNLLEDHENHLEYFINNNSTRALSSMTGPLASKYILIQFPPPPFYKYNTYMYLN